MAEVLLGLVGVAVGGVLFLAGLAVGGLAGRKRTKDWLDENGCYLCQEKYKNRLLG